MYGVQVILNLMLGRPAVLSVVVAGTSYRQHSLM